MKLDRTSTLVKFSYLIHILLNAEKAYPTGTITTRWDNTQVQDMEYAVIPFRTSLCAFFWRTFVLVPGIIIGLGTALSVAAYMLARFLGVHLLEVAYVLAALGNMAVIGMLLIWAEPWIKPAFVKGGVLDRMTTKLDDRITASIESGAVQSFIQGLKAIKHKVCPIIELK